MYKSERNDSESPLWEKRIVFISAVDELEAEEKARRNAKKYESEFITLESVAVAWKFHKVERVFFIENDIEDWMELFSRFLRNSEAESILTPFDDSL